MSEWKEYRLGEIGTVVGGATPSTKNPSFYDGEIPWITPKDLTDWKEVYISKGERSITKEGYDSSSCKLMPKGTVLFTSRAPIGYIAIAANELCTNQGFKSIVPNNELVDSEFLYYALLYNRNRIKALGSGTTFAEISGKVMASVVVSIPDLATQKRIAEMLSEIDDKIAINRRICENLEAQAQALFKHWFIDFAPFKNGKFVESELGMIPEGWRVGIVDEFCRVFTGKKNTNQAEENGLYPFFSCAPSPLASNDYLYDGNAVIIAGNGSFTGRTSFYRGRFDLYQRTYACVAKEKSFEKNVTFIYFMMKHFFEPVKMGGTRGSSIPYIVMGDITKQTFPYSEIVVNRFSTIVSTLITKQLEIQQENKRLSALRDTLLPKLMSGEIKV